MPSDNVEYSQYLHSRHWIDLKAKHIYHNSQAQCFISHKTDKLVLHHSNYGALYHEKLGKDVHILNADYHQLVHFWFFGRLKVPLTSNWLLFSMRVRRMIFCIQSGQFGLFIIWFLVIFIIGMWNIGLFFLFYLVKVINSLIWLVLRSLLAKINIDIK